jgi:hypothetical protein
MSGRWERLAVWRLLANRLLRGERSRRRVGIIARRAALAVFVELVLQGVVL